MSVVAQRPAPHDIPEGRQFAWLVPYLQKAEIDAVLSQNPFRIVDHRPLDQVVHDARQAATGLRPYVMQPVQALSAELQAAADSVRARDVFRREYDAKFDAEFGMVALDSLIAPQPLADLDYVETLMDQLPAAPDLLQDFHFAFPEEPIPEPVVVGNTVTFASHAPNIYVAPVPTYRRVSGGYEIVVRAESRPNYLFVAELAGVGGRLILVNGVHHVLAMIKAGRKQAPAVVRRAIMVQELGIPPTTLLGQISAARPPLVKDFFSPCAVSVVKRATAVATQVLFQTNQLMFPADGPTR